MHEHVPGNVGVLDEGIRVALAAGILVLLGIMLRWDANAALILLLAGLPAIGYLLLSSFVHVDPVYIMLRIDTRHHDIGHH